MPTIIDLGPVSAYAVAKAHGFSGTEQEWEEYISNASIRASEAVAAKNAAVAAKDLAESYAADALESKNSAIAAENDSEANALDSEAYAVGTRDGSPVAASDPTYQNNSKYYCERAEAVAVDTHEENVYDLDSYESTAIHGKFLNLSSNKIASGSYTTRTIFVPARYVKEFHITSTAENAHQRFAFCNSTTVGISIFGGQAYTAPFDVILKSPNVSYKYLGIQFYTDADVSSPTDETYKTYQALMTVVARSAVDTVARFGVETNAEDISALQNSMTGTSNDVGDLKSAVNVICPYEEITDWTINYGYNTTGSVGSVIDLEHPEQNDAVRCTYVSCQPGDKFTYMGGSSSSYRPFAYLKSDGTLIKKATYTSYDRIVTTAPDEAAYILFNRNKNVTTHVYKGYLAEKQDKLTFDETPTDGSANPVTSGGIFDALTAVEGEIDTVRETVEEEIDALGLMGTAEGIELAAFDDALAKPIKSLSIALSPKQEGSGTPSLDNLRPITRWTGLTINHSGEDMSDPDELVLDFGTVSYGLYGGKVTYSGNGTWTVQKIWDGMMTNADGALQRYGGTAVYNWTGNKSSNYVYFSASESNTGVIEDSELCNMYKHGAPSSGSDQIVHVYRANGNSRVSLQDTSIPGWTSATTNSGLASVVKAYFADLYTQGIQFQCVWKLTTPSEYQITTDELVALLGKNRYWANGIDSIRVEYAEVTTTAVDAIRAGTFSYAGKNVAIIGDSISTNGNWSVSNPLGNVPEIIVQTEDVGVSLSAYVTYYDVGTTIGGHTITESEVGTEITFNPTSEDVGKVVGKPLNNNAAATATWWEVAAATLGFNPIPVAWSGSSITSHEENVTDSGHYIYKCSYAWHESQIRKCGIRVPGTMNRIAPDMVIIYRGANDLTHSPYSRITDYMDSYPTAYPTGDTYDDSGTTRYDYAKGMRLLINNLRTAYPQTKIVLCTMNYFRRLGSSKWTTNGTDNWQKYNDMIRRLAAYEGCDLIDFAKDGLSWANAKYGYYNEGTSDSANWTHPNTKGHAVLGARALRDLLTVNDKPVVD